VRVEGWSDIRICEVRPVVVSADEQRAVIDVFVKIEGDGMVVDSQDLAMQAKPARSRPVEPQIDTPVVLKAYAEKFGADPAGWSFLTGSGEEIQDVVRKYGAFAKRVKPGDVDHLFLTSLIDRKGMLRVQYLGYRFDADEMLKDLRVLLRE